MILQIDPDASMGLLQKLALMQEREELCDFTILVSGCAVKAHKCVLAANCDYFNSSFRFGETSEMDLTHLNCDLKVVKKIVRSFYTNEIDLDLRSLESVLLLLDYFMCESLRNCVEAFMERTLSFHTGVLYFQLALQYRLNSTALLDNTKWLLYFRFHDYFLYQPEVLESSLDIVTSYMTYNFFDFCNPLQIVEFMLNNLKSALKNNEDSVHKDTEVDQQERIGATFQKLYFLLNRVKPSTLGKWLPRLKTFLEAWAHSFLSANCSLCELNSHLQDLKTWLSEREILMNAPMPINVCVHLRGLPGSSEIELGIRKTLLENSGSSDDIDTKRRNNSSIGHSEIDTKSICDVCISTESCADPTRSEPSPPPLDNTENKMVPPGQVDQSETAADCIGLTEVGKSKATDCTGLTEVDQTETADQTKLAEAAPETSPKVTDSGRIQISRPLHDSDVLEAPNNSSLNEACPHPIHHGSQSTFPASPTPKQTASEASELKLDSHKEGGQGNQCRVLVVLAPSADMAAQLIAIDDDVRPLLRSPKLELSFYDIEMKTWCHGCRFDLPVPGLMSEKHAWRIAHLDNCLYLFSLGRELGIQYNILAKKWNNLDCQKIFACHVQGAPVRSIIPVKVGSKLIVLSMSREAKADGTFWTQQCYFELHPETLSFELVGSVQGDRMDMPITQWTVSDDLLITVKASTMMYRNLSRIQYIYVYNAETREVQTYEVACTMQASVKMLVKDKVIYLTDLEGWCRSYDLKTAAWTGLTKCPIAASTLHRSYNEDSYYPALTRVTCHEGSSRWEITTSRNCFNASMQEMVVDSEGELSARFHPPAPFQFMAAMCPGTMSRLQLDSLTQPRFVQVDNLMLEFSFQGESDCSV